MILDENGCHWFKGNLHTHTTRSDGQRTPQEVCSLYRSKGYDFIAFTDHWQPSETQEDNDFLLLSGCEYHVGSNVQEGIYHIVSIGALKNPNLEKTTDLTPQNIIDCIHSVDGLAILAHPAWSLDKAEDTALLTGLDGCEIYNTTSGIPWNCRPYSGFFLDELACMGIQLKCIAADDAHWYNGDETRSYLMVKAESLTRDSIVTAIRNGDFYATQGPNFSVSIANGQLKVSSTPVKTVVFFTDTVYASDRVTHGDNIQEAIYTIKPSDSFVRVELTDAQGNMAWSSFFKVHTA